MIDKQRLYRAYWKLEQRIVPGLVYSQTHYEAVLGRYVTPTTRWLDVGCGRHLLPSWRHDAERELIARASSVVGIDLDFDSLRDNKSIAALCRSSVAELPFAAGSFSLVTANMVMEHVDAPAPTLRELHRVLVPGGHLIFHTPNAQAFPTAVARLLPESFKKRLAYVLEGRGSKDVFPTYYHANRPAEIREHAARTGFEVAELNLVSTTAVFSLVLPLALLELLWIRSLRAPGRADRRSNIIAVLRRV
jgi:2-polyprenyl-3-methyl-5-hydroxy-6-metoxy-1,4-benzoquinol methylase